ncbi:DNA-binding protein H-NS [Roseivivax sediminis]|uniref:DNA-binding protein H-NS n=2 Tax=Roseivivax sediminis TaxID=936889 RepID=A0A1I1U9Z7_9RHOB|nr:DNA-binding protein H-NS [Roseivivax sediminis]
MLSRPFLKFWKVKSMAEIDVLSLNKDELQDLRKRIDVALEQRELRDKQEALEAAEAAARKSGFSLSDLLGETTKTRAPKPAKFADPKDRTRTWSGRGRKPNWYLKALEEGYSEADMRIS